MNLKEYAEEKGITIKEAKELTGLTHWKQIVPESCDEIEEVAETVDLGDKIVIETESKQEEFEGVDPKVIELSIRCLGTKSQYWKK